MIAVWLGWAAAWAADEPEVYLLAQPAALIALDSTGAPFLEPATPTDFAAAASRVIDTDLTPKPGGAFELSASALRLTQKVSYADYQASWARRALGRSAVSVATAAGSEGDVRLAAGVRSALLHEADPLLDEHYAAAITWARQECAAKAAEAEAAEAEAAGAGAAEADAAEAEAAGAGAAGAGADFDRLACQKKAYEERFADAPPPPWNSSGLILAGAYVASLDGGRFGGFTTDQSAVWLSGALGVKTWGQAGLAMAWTHSFSEGWDRLAPTVRLRGSMPGARLALEAGYALTLHPGALPEHSLSGALGGEVRLSEGSWVYADIGVQVDPDTGLVTLLQTTDLRWGRATEPTFAEDTSP